VATNQGAKRFPITPLSKIRQELGVGQVGAPVYELVDLLHDCLERCLRHGIHLF
jgi:hypothetical protein